MKKKLSVILCAALVLSALCAALLTACNDKPNEPAVYTLDPDRDFGLYWYNDEGEKMLSEADMPVEFYDPEKPTVVYSHGWKMNPVPEELVTQQSTVESTKGLSGERDYAAELRAAGYNVGYFDWHLYAADLTYLDDEIWTVATETPDNDSNYAAAVKALNGRSFAGEFAREIATVMKNAVNTDLHFVGHSYGGQMVTAAAYTLAKMYDQGLVVNPACVPDRVSLADPYIPSEALGGYTKGTLDIIGGKYRVHIIWALMDGPKRFGQLHSSYFRDVNANVLSRQLKELEADGLITRRVLSDNPPWVEYALTTTGQTLIPLLEAMSEWGSLYQDMEREKARLSGSSRSPG